MTLKLTQGCLRSMKQLSSHMIAPLCGLVFAVFLGLFTSALADGMNGLRIKDGWSRETTAGARVGGGYLTIMNHGQVPDRLLAVRAEHAGMSEVHTMAMQDDVMVMRPVEEPLLIEPGAILELRPGCLHLMFMQLNQQHVAGEMLDIVLVFERAGELDATLEVLSMRDSMDRMRNSGDHMGHGDQASHDKNGGANDDHNDESHSHN